MLLLNDRKTLVAIPFVWAYEQTKCFFFFFFFFLWFGRLLLLLFYYYLFLLCTGCLFPCCHCIRLRLGDFISWPSAATVRSFSYASVNYSDFHRLFHDYNCEVWGYANHTINTRLFCFDVLFCCRKKSSLHVYLCSTADFHPRARTRDHSS